jgi:polysaccharide biosynthesis protein PslH
MKLLFICYRDVNDKSYGGSQCTNRNYLSFCELIGSENVEVVDLKFGLKKSLSQKISKRFNYLFGFKEGLSQKKIKSIRDKSKGKNYIFIDSSSYGIIAYYLRKGNFNGKIICFFHNVEYKIQLHHLRRNPLSFWRLIVSYYNEKNAIKHSDEIVALNKRDSDELKRLYGRGDIKIIPISLIDTFKDKVEEFTSNPPTLLFIGNNWFANIHGLKWFVKNVLPYVNIKLQIIGSGMDKLENEFVHPNIEFMGFVPDLSPALLKADFIVCPIFIGGGMKVKTCEALMYGKNIIGTKEAFEGYEIDYTKVGANCNNKEEFINAIQNYCSIKKKKFNEYNRKCFLEKYSFQATMNKFDGLILKQDPFKIDTNV